ncbi:hypothetical protein HANVADRAFT_4236 [Hanseniaspora valbyensis NRRL Y-1626]|uniref:Nucleolar protein 16 n=1 Tax=Hanseniaspora valbyensis NRRL Y-1626 TaxID=766949 RepID=A0A1B7T893_9ASCO|nr:hypothetical protein HANVADRAFT_4236 [Hanseniaspora valbyensis NRRL Y-1626]
MGSVRQRRKQHSTTKKASRRTKDSQRKINIHSNKIIAENWDYNATLAQNYKRLGLSAKLQKSAGGDQINYDLKKSKNGTVKKSTLADLDSSDDEEEEEEEENESKKTVDESDIFFDPAELNDNGEYIAERIPEGEARIVKDNEGKIVSIIYGTMKAFDIDVSVEDLRKKEEKKPKTDVVKQLEEIANQPVVKKDRHLSEREDKWIEALYTKHNDNYRKMVMDKKLNIYQQTESTLRNKVLKWKKRHDISE